MRSHDDTFGQNVRPLFCIFMQVLVDDDGNDAGSTSGEELTISSKNAVIDSTETFQAIESLIPAKFEGEAKAPEGRL